MATTKLHSEAILKDLLTGSGIPALVRLAADAGQRAPTDPPAPLTADDLATMPLAAFATRSLILRVWADLLGEEVWFVSREAQVQVLQRRGIPRGKIFTARELIDLLKLFRVDKRKALLVCEAKKLFGGSLRIDD